MDDLISRAAAIRALASSNGDYLDALERIEKIPAVDAAPVVHGTWEVLGDCGITRCLACKWNFEGCIDYKYCPQCGARMDGERRENDD